MNKRTERVKSIFDSDDSEEEYNITNLSLSYHKDEDIKFHKTIEEVCSSLANENEDNGIIVSHTMEVPDELLKGTEKEEITRSNCCSDSEEEDKNLQKEDSTTKFNIPIIEENEYNLLSKFCKETDETILEEETELKPTNLDEICLRGEILEHKSCSDKSEGDEVLQTVPNTDSLEPKECGLGEDINLGKESSHDLELPENTKLEKAVCENLEEKIVDSCECPEIADCYDDINNKSMDTCDNLPTESIGDNSENVYNSNKDNIDNLKKISNESHDMDQCEFSKENSEEISEHANSNPLCSAMDFGEHSDKFSRYPTTDIDNHKNLEEENLINQPTSPLEKHMIGKPEDEILSSLVQSPKSIKIETILPLNTMDETNHDVNLNSVTETSEHKLPEPIVIPGELDSCEMHELGFNISSIINGSKTSSAEKIIAVDTQPMEMINSIYSCEGEKKRKVRVEDVFTDSENETASNCSPIKHALLKDSEGDANDPNKGPPLKKTRRKRPRATSINLPAIMLAFEKGWVREVVYRSAANVPIFPKRADIYYYTPEGKKLRSRIEIEDYLKKNNIVDLTLQNFSFFKEPLGVEECYEKIRHASVLKSPIAPNKNEDDQQPKEVLKKRMRKSAKFKDGVLPAKKLRNEMLTVNKQAKNLSEKNMSLKETQRFYGSGNFANFSNNYSPVYATHLFPCNPPILHPRIITSLIKGASKDKAFHCTPNCLASGGSVPNLQCVKCVCLFHPDCCHIPLAAVPFILSSQAKFLCPNCYKEETGNFEEKEYTPVPCYEPLAYDPSSDSEDEGLCSDYEHPSYTKLLSRPLSPETTAFQFRQLSNLHSSNISMLAPSMVLSDSEVSFGNSHFVLNSSLDDDLGPSVPQYMTPYLQTNNAISNSFPSSTKSGPAISLSLPGTTYFCPNSLTPNSCPPRSPSPCTPTIEDFTKVSKVPSHRRVGSSRIITQVTQFLRGGEHFMEDMSKSYNVLRHIFSFLSVTDLLVVSRVCHMWRDLALGPNFWTSIRLRNVCVKDWGKMVEFLERRGTSSLDLRKMVLRIGAANQYAEKLTLQNRLERSLSDSNVNQEMEIVNRSDSKEINMDESKEDIENKAAESNICVNKNKESDYLKLDTESQFEKSSSVMESFSQENALEKNAVEGSDGNSSEKANEVEMSKEIRGASVTISEEPGINFKVENMEVDFKKVNIETDIKEENMEIEVEDDNMESDNVQEKNEQNSIMEVNQILVHEIDALSKNHSFLHSESIGKITPSSENSEVHNESSSKEAKDEEKIKEIKKDKIVTSVLSEHDYFGPQTKIDESGDSSSNSSSDSEDSESQPDQNELEADRALDEKLEFHKKNVEDGNLKEMLQWEHEPQFRESHLASVSGDSRNTQEEVGGEEVEMVSKLRENLKENVQLLKPLYREWDAISNALSSLRCLHSIVIGPCESVVVELILSHCNQLTSITALNLITSDDEAVISFDPSFLMHTKQLEEFRLGSKKNFLFKSNFNFIKLPNLKVLMLKGLKTAETGWPYMGIHQTHLHLSCINTFSHNNWLNISSMAGLLELELDGSGADFDSEICAALTKLVQLKRLALLDWNIGPKLPFTLRKLHNIKYLHVIPAAELPGLRGIYAGRLMVMLDFTKHLEEFVWGIQPPNRIMDEKTGEKIYIQTMKPGKETGVMEGEMVRAIAIDSFKGFIKCRIPQTKITVRKVASSNWITGDGWF